MLTVFGRAAVVVAAVVPVGAIACTGSVKQAGLEVIVATNLRIPDDFDTVHLKVEQQVADGGTRPPIVDADFPVASQSALPAAYGITPGVDPDQVAFIEATARLGDRVIVTRAAQIQVPTDWLAQYVMVLSAKCIDVICLAGNTCDPDTGNCVSDVVPPSALGPYMPGQPFDAGSLSDATIPRADAGAPEGTTPTSEAGGETGLDGEADVATGPDGEAGGSCPQGQDCRPAGTCQVMTEDCTSGVPVCVAGVGSVHDGTSCGGANTCCGGICTDTSGSDANNCGACGHGCLGGACSGGACQPTPLVSGAAGAPAVAALITNGPTIFWGYHNSGTDQGVLSCPDGGCSMSPFTLTTNAGGYPLFMAVTGGSVYWVARTLGNPNVFSCAISGCGATPSAHGALSSSAGASALAVDAANLYWAGQNASSQTAIMECPLGGSTCSPGSQFALATTTNVVWHGALYWTDTSLAALMKCTSSMPNGACLTTAAVSATGGGPSVLAVDDTNAYWADADGVKQCANVGCGGAAPTLLASGVQNANSMVTDGAHVYWANGSSIVRAQVGSRNSATAIAQNQSGAAAVAVATKAVYWALSDGSIMMLAR